MYVWYVKAKLHMLYHINDMYSKHTVSITMTWYLKMIWNHVSTQWYQICHMWRVPKTCWKHMMCEKCDFFSWNLCGFSARASSDHCVFPPPRVHQEKQVPLGLRAPKDLLVEGVCQEPLVQEETLALRSVLSLFINVISVSQHTWNEDTVVSTALQREQMSF